MAKRDNEQAAKILIEAMFSTDTKVARKHGITTRTLQNYRAALADDDALSLTFARQFAIFRGLDDQAAALTETEAAVQLGFWVTEMEGALSQMVGEAKALWLELKADARNFDQKMRVFQLALSFMAQLGEPLIVKEVMGGSSDNSSEGKPVSAPSEDGAADPRTWN